VYLGTSASIAGAANLAAEYLQIPVHDLSREKAQRETPEQFCARVRAQLKAFKEWVAGELASSVELRQASDYMQEHAPAVHVAGLLGKEDSWRRALANVSVGTSHHHTVFKLAC